MTTDPRLLDTTLLTLAAMRARQRHQRPDWQTTVGLAALLEAARFQPPRAPVNLQEIDTSSGLGKLLLEARQWEQEHRHGP